MSQADDRELERYLAGDDPLSRAYARTPREEPPASVDEFVLAAARQEPRARPRRWMAPLAAAAVVLLGITTTLSLLEDEAIIGAGDFATPQPAELEQMEAEVSSEARLSAAPASRSAPPPPAPLAPQRGVGDSARKAESAAGFAKAERRQSADAADTASSWINRIRSLRQQGQEDAARREFAAFRSLYPNRELPEDLQDLDSRR